MGQLELIGRRQHIGVWAHAMGYTHKSSQAAMGQLELIGGSILTLWAHASACTQDPASFRGPTRVDRQVAAHLYVGPCEGMRGRAYKLPWANSSLSAGDNTFILWAHVLLVALLATDSMGPCKFIVGKS